MGIRKWSKGCIRKADYEKDQVQVASYSKGGTSLYDVDKLASAMVTDQFIGAYGLGDYDAITLRKLLTANKHKQVLVSVDFPNPWRSIYPEWFRNFNAIDLPAFRETSFRQRGSPNHDAT